MRSMALFIAFLHGCLHSQFEQALDHARDRPPVMIIYLISRD